MTEQREKTRSVGIASSLETLAGGDVPVIITAAGAVGRPLPPPAEEARVVGRATQQAPRRRRGLAPLRRL